jgi:hypothetical protein
MTKAEQIMEKIALTPKKIFSAVISRARQYEPGLADRLEDGLQYVLKTSPKEGVNENIPLGPGHKNARKFISFIQDVSENSKKK